MNIKAWLSAFRLRTLPLSLSGIIIGSFIAKQEGYWNGLIFSFAMLTTILFQILSNLANDLGDSQKGTDNEHRIGPTRAVQSGEISFASMKKAVLIFSVLSLLAAAGLIYLSANNLTKEIIWMYFGLAALCILAAITYTVGKRAYGYNGLGDIMVFLFFGLVSVLGVYSLYTSKFIAWNILPASAVGLLSAAVLNLNNMRDIENDEKSGKITLVVRMGLNKAKIYHCTLILASCICLIAFLAHKELWIPYIFLAVSPYIILLVHLSKVSKVKNPRDFDPELKKVALSTFAISVLTAIAISLG